MENEKFDLDVEMARGPSVIPKNDETKSGVSTQEKVEEEENLPQKEEVEQSGKLVTPQSVIDLQRDMARLRINVQNSAHAKEDMRRAEEEHRLRSSAEQKDEYVKSSQRIVESIRGQWSDYKQEEIPEELQEALNCQEQLCISYIEAKKKLLNEQLQVLKVKDGNLTKDLRKQGEELDLIIERLTEQTKTLKKVYREEVARLERHYQHEFETLLTKEKTEFDHRMRELSKKNLEWQAASEKKVEEYEATVKRIIYEEPAELNQVAMTSFQAFLREMQQKLKTEKLMEQKQFQKKDTSHIQPKKRGSGTGSRAASQSFQTGHSAQQSQPDSERKEGRVRSGEGKQGK